eukprot:6492726-Amphidinium_carterae.10
MRRRPVIGTGCARFSGNQLFLQPMIGHKHLARQKTQKFQQSEVDSEGVRTSDSEVLRSSESEDSLKTQSQTQESEHTSRCIRMSKIT